MYILVDGVTHVRCIDGNDLVLQKTELVVVLSKTVQVVILGQSGNKLDELVLEDQDGASGVKEHITSSLAGHLEAEGRSVRPGDLEFAVLGRSALVGLGPGHDGLRETVPRGVGSIDVARGDLDVQSALGQELDGQIQRLDVVTVHIARLAGQLQLGRHSTGIVLDARCLVTGTNVLSIDGLRVINVGDQGLTVVDPGRNSELVVRRARSRARAVDGLQEGGTGQEVLEANHDGPWLYDRRKALDVKSYEPSGAPFL